MTALGLITLGLVLGLGGGVGLGVVMRDAWSTTKEGDVKTLSERVAIEAWKAMSSPHTADDEKRAIAAIVAEHNAALAARRAIDYARKHGHIGGRP